MQMHIPKTLTSSHEHDQAKMIFRFLTFFCLADFLKTPTKYFLSSLKSFFFLSFGINVI